MTTKRKIIVYIATFIVIAAIVLFIYHYKNKLGKIITPFFMAVIIAYLINPLIRKMELKGINRRIGVLLIYFWFAVIVATVIIFLIPELVNNTRDLSNMIPEIAARYQSMVTSFLSAIQSSNWPQDIKNAMFGEIRNGIAIAQAYIMDTLKKSVSTAVDTVLAMFDLVLSMLIAYYFIKDGEIFKNSILSLSPRKWRNGLIAAGKEINAVLSNFIQGQLLVALIVGILETIGLLIVGIKYSFVLGLIGGLANIIPYFGPILGAIPAVAIALIQSPMKALWTLLVFVVVQQLDNAFISSKIIEGRLGLHPVTTILVVLVGGEFFGIAGMLVSVPIAAILKVIAKRTIEAIV